MPVIANGTTSFSEQSRRAYVATGVFNTAFFSYTGTRDANNIIQYALGAVTGATTGNCVAGHVLKENGRKLVPGANPGVTNYMVGVFDSSSCLNGFIDPNNNLFAVYSTDLPNFVGRGVDTVTGPDGTTNDMGPPVYTNGTVTADGSITTNDGNLVATNGNIVITATATLGKGKLNVPATGANAIVGTSGALVATGGGSILTVATTAVTASSKIFLTYASAAGTQGFLRVSAIVAATSFTITSSSATDTSTVNWFIVN